MNLLPVRACTCLLEAMVEVVGLRFGLFGGMMIYLQG